MDLSRRFFLGGAISLIAAQTFVPSVSAMSNLPTIYGDGKHDDSDGLGALFRNDPVTFKKEQIGVETHKGVIFHKGHFLVDKTIRIPLNTTINFESKAPLCFVQGKNLTSEFPFFICEGNDARQFDQVSRFEITTHRGKLIDVRNDAVRIMMPKSGQMKDYD